MNVAAPNHQPFHYHSVADLQADIADAGLDLEAQSDFSNLLTPVKVGQFTLPNRLVVLPMEGCDGKAGGAPDALTFRRYHRFAAGGAGLLWIEATAIAPEARANPRQLWLHEQTVREFQILADETRRTAAHHNGAAHRPLLIVQLTHSGRYSKPGPRPQPIIAHHSPFLDPTHQLPLDYPLITDDQLERLEDAYVEAARCAQAAGFDGVDIKACHRYLMSELLASFTRDGSRYGGSFENRTRLFRNVVAKIRAALPGFLVTTRLNVYDAMAYPYGFGVDRQNPAQPDLTEPKALIQFLRESAVPLVNITIGNPYYNPHVNRPFDLPVSGAPMPAESPLLGVSRFIQIVREIQAAFPAMAVIGGGYSWLRQFFPHVAAANVRRGWVSLVGLGRMAFAYPDFARDLLLHGRLDPNKVCVACSACTQIMRDGGRSGCVPRDAEVYEPIYKQGRAEALDTIQTLARSCRQCNDPACVSKCPAQVNIPKFVSQIVAGKFQDAYATLREANVLAATCGYVCPSETLCESGCLNQHYSAPVPIRQLQQWVGRRAVEEGWLAITPPAVASGKRVAVIGAGPAGIAAAATLAGFGHSVLLMDRSTEPGGTAAGTIPQHRLPDSIWRREIDIILRAHASLISRRGFTLDASHTLDSMLQEGFDAVLLALGLTQSTPLPHSKRPSQGLLSALEFLAQAKRGGRISGAVLILGGGNTAIDAALAAQQTGAEDVAIVYRRSFAEMPAWPEERDKAIRAGIVFLPLTAPLDYAIDHNDCLVGLKVARTRLGPRDSRGRRTPIIIPNSEHVLPANWVIEALGQQLDETVKSALADIRFTESGLLWTSADSLQTSRPGVFAAGDIVNGGQTVVQAVAEGTRAAREINAFLSSKSEI